MESRSLWFVSLLALACSVGCSVETAQSPRGSGGSASGAPGGSPGSGGKSDGTGGSAASGGGSGGASGASPGLGGAAGVAGAAGASADAGPTPACSALDPRSVPVEVAVLPDAGEAPFVDVLATAQTRIDVMVYQMGYGGVLDTLTAKAKAGVAVRVILDVSQTSVNQKYFDALTGAGAEVEWSDPSFTYMHAKVAVIDGSVALISTGNYLKSFMLKERNFVITDRDPWDLENLDALFEADWKRLSPSLDCTRLVVSPINSRDRIMSLITGATSTLTIESMQFADTAVRNAVAARKAAGVDVRVLLAAPSWISSNTSAASFLAQQGIPARYLGAPSVHVKAIVADGTRAYAGSENLSYTSLDKNREVGAFMTEPPAVAAIASTFEKDWANATAF